MTPTENNYSIIYSEMSKKILHLKVKVMNTLGYSGGQDQRFIFVSLTTQNLNKSSPSSFLSLRKLATRGVTGPDHS